MKTLRPALYLLLGGLLTVIGLELTLRLLPVSSATMVDYHVSPTILTYPPHHDFTVSTGWDMKNAQRLRSNNVGFVDTQDFVPNPSAIAVIGDSFVEANMLAPDQRVGPALARVLNNATVYSLGGPGSSLLDYAERAQLASQQWGVQRFVFVLEVGDVRQALCGSGNHQGPCINPGSGALEAFRLPAASGLKTWARHSALAQYVFSQLKFNPSALLASLGSKKTAPQKGGNQSDPVSPQLARAIITRFLDALPSTAQPPVLLIDGARGRSSTETNWNLAHMALLKEMAKAAGARVIDLAPRFDAWHATSALSLEVGPYDGHWNPIGHQIAAEAAAEALRGD
ncbi:MAG: hypothetical protein FHP92_11510 [Denitromonas halophila]|nr:MAG: hypothetical protein FHP92_11510 [Denitromonas halophila]